MRLLAMLVMLIIGLGGGCLPYASPASAPVGVSAAEVASGRVEILPHAVGATSETVAKCKRDSVVHAIGVGGALAATVTSLALGWVTLEMSNTDSHRFAVAGAALVAGGAGLLGIATSVVGTELYSHDGCVPVLGQLGPGAQRVSP